MDASEVLIRPREAADDQELLRLHLAAFDGSGEARLVDALHRAGKAVVSLVAVADRPGGPILGHILFSPVEVEGCGSGTVLGLAPMAVTPHRQRGGIGSELVEAGIAACRAADAAGCVVLGDPGFYSRFGFQPASEFGLSCEYDAPPEAFRAMELREAGLAGATGVVHYGAEFGAL